MSRREYEWCERYSNLHWHVPESQVEAIIEGPTALFSNPQSPEGMTLPVPPPSAAAGIFSAVFRLPQMRWVPDEVRVLSPEKPVYTEMRNGVRKVTKLAPEKNLVDARFGSGKSGPPQARYGYLQDVRYYVRAHPALTSRPDGGGHSAYIKYAAIFRRRLKAGRCFRQPYLGTSDCPCVVRPVGDGDVILPHPDYAGRVEAVRMRHHIDYDNATGMGKARNALFLFDEGRIFYNRAFPEGWEYNAIPDTF